MKHQESITDVITKNFNYALEAIPRAFGAEKPKRKTAKRRKTATATAKRKVKTVKAKGKRAVKKAVKKVKRAVKSVAKKAQKVQKTKRTNNVHKLPHRKSSRVTHARAA